MKRFLLLDPETGMYHVSRSTWTPTRSNTFGARRKPLITRCGGVRSIRVADPFVHKFIAVETVPSGEMKGEPWLVSICWECENSFRNAARALSFFRLVA